jgi:Flp pilus assembly protein TadD
MKKKLYAKAIEDFTLVVAGNPDDAGSLYQRGMAYDKLGQTNEAIGDYSRMSPRPVPHQASA